MGAEQVEQLVVERFFQGERAVARRQRLVLESLQLGRDVALGVLERLAAAVVGGHLGGVGVGDLDVETVHAVVGDAQVGDAGDRKSTRLNSSHLVISYAVFCL